MLGTEQQANPRRRRNHRLSRQLGHEVVAGQPYLQVPVLDPVDVERYQRPRWCGRVSPRFYPPTYLSSFLPTYFLWLL